MATHRIKATLTGYLEVDDESLPDYEADNIVDAMRNQLTWLTDNGDTMAFVADSIHDIKLELEVGSTTLSTDDL